MTKEKKLFFTYNSEDGITSQIIAKDYEEADSKNVLDDDYILELTEKDIKFLLKQFKNIE